MGFHRCSCETGVTQAAEYPRAIFALAPWLPPSVGRSTSPPDRLWAPSRVGGELALLDVCAKKFGIRTFWHNLALRLPVRAELRTVCRGYRSTDFFADFLAALVVPWRPRTSGQATRSGSG